jgi:hypothetical protein
VPARGGTGDSHGVDDQGGGSEGTIQGLKGIGKQRGCITLEEVKAALPIDTMTPDELGSEVLELVEVGVEILLDEGLSRPRPESGSNDDLSHRLLTPGPEPDTTAASPAKAARSLPFKPPRPPGLRGASPPGLGLKGLHNALRALPPDQFVPLRTISS